MISLKDIKGQENAIRYLVNSHKSGRMSGSYIFSGSRGVGRALTAKAFLASLVCSASETGACSVCPACRRIESGDHPDIKWIKPEKNKKIKIEEIRKVKEVLSLKPFEAPVNVCVIEDAHMMTTEAANALLKVLEEPPGSSMIILITDKKEWLLPTVVSRCAEVRFKSLSIKDASEIVMRVASVPEEEGMFLSYLSQGSPGRAIEMMEDGLLERKESLLEFMENIASEKNPSCMNWMDETKDIIIEDIELLIMLLRDLAFYKQGLGDLMLDRNLEGGQMFDSYSIDKIYTVMERLLGAKRALAGNVNAKLVAQVLPGMMA